MNYYERHLGDYAKDTAHLSMLEIGAYDLLLDRYYSTEQGIPADQAHRVTRARSKEERAAVDAVLTEFFTLSDGIWMHNRAEREIDKARVRIRAAQDNGTRGGRPRKNPTGTQEKPGGFPLGSVSETQSKAHQAPSTKHQTPEEKPSSAQSPIPAQGAEPPPTADARALAGEVSKAMRTAGVMAQPMDPRLRALVAGGLDAATATAACEEARTAKPAERIPPAYVFAILERWQADPSGVPPRVAARRSPEDIAAGALRLLEERDRLQAQEPDHATH